jgi:hypothetical protein
MTFNLPATLAIELIVAYVTLNAVQIAGLLPYGHSSQQYSFAKD